MKRRNFGLMAGCGMAAIGVGAGFPRPVRAGVPAGQAAQLKTTLTPFGAERAGNADGTVPAWTGGLTQTQPGWSDGQQQPDYFASDAMTLRIDKSNVAQHTGMLSDGLVLMINKYEGFNVQIYPAHRTAAAPQWVYDNMYQNALSSSLDPRGGRFGFSGAYGGVAFPILDSDPKIAGAQVIWNHLTRWDAGPSAAAAFSAYIITRGTVTLNDITTLTYYYPYYLPTGNVTAFDGWLEKIRSEYLTPPVLVGQVLCEWSSTNALTTPTQAWELLNGQGRVRKAPELTYDTPTASNGGISNYDEQFGFYGSPDRYNWTYVAKKEMYIPYNNNKLVSSDPHDVIGKQYLDPAAVRYEKHRVHVIDAILAPGERHAVPRKRFYVDEDNWHIAYVDEYDGNGSFLKTSLQMNINVPNLPGTIFAQQVVHNLQSDLYTVGSGIFTNAAHPGYSFAPVSLRLFNPQAMASQSQY